MKVLAGVSGVFDSRWRMWPYLPSAILEFSREWATLPLGWFLRGECTESY